MGLGAIPAGWRFDRGMYSIALPDTGWLVNLEHPDSIAALERTTEPQLSRLGVPSLNTSVLRGDRREVTTMLAETASGSILDDGSSPIGIHFGSKHGGAWCKAFWLDHPQASTIIPLSPDAILQTDRDLNRVADRFRIRVF